MSATKHQRIPPLSPAVPPPPSPPTSLVTASFPRLSPPLAAVKTSCIPSTTLSSPDRYHQRDAALLSVLPLVQASKQPRKDRSPSSHSQLGGLRLQTSNLSVANHRPNVGAPSSGPSRSASFVDSLSPGSATSAHSPAMEHLAKMTPLPSPIVTGDSPGPWNKFRRPISRKPSRTGPTPPRSVCGSESALVTSSGESVSTALAAQSQRKIYQGLTSVPGAESYHSSNSSSRSRDDSETGSLVVPHSRSRDPFKSTLGGTDETGIPQEADATGGFRMKREDYLAQPRRWTISSSESSPSPALSGSATSLSSISSTDTAIDSPRRTNRLIKKQRLESFEAKTVPGNKVRKWRGLGLLGHGTFSKVILATSEDIPDEVDSLNEDGVVVEREPLSLDPRKLVAVKIVEHGAAGGASKERVESSLKRELDILKSVNHPALVRLRAYSVEPKRALLVLPYCPGGDLFDLASDSSFPLGAPLVRRMFAEIVSAIRYLHKHGIVHRDVKLESTKERKSHLFPNPSPLALTSMLTHVPLPDVLINFTRPQLLQIAKSPPYNSPLPITTLTDVGLSRRVDFTSANHLLTTRCGSDDYASPELIMAQPYDGRETDAWALGVLLFALMEGRLPFDPPPGSSELKMRSKTAHRIARCEWKWVKLAGVAVTTAATKPADADVNGRQEEEAGEAEFAGGKRIVEGLLRRAGKRWKLEAVEADEWARDAILVELGDPVEF